jgi:hypothetical protein
VQPWLLRPRVFDVQKQVDKAFCSVRLTSSPGSQPRAGGWGGWGGWGPPARAGAAAA